MSRKKKNRVDTNEATRYTAVTFAGIMKPIVRFLNSVLQHSMSIFYLQIVLLIITCILLIGWETFRDREVFIDEILVPTELEQIGYTSPVIGQRLIDSLTCYYTDDERYGRGDSASIYEVNASQASSEEDIVVPTMGVSINAIASYFRRIFQSNEHTINGEILFHQSDNLVFLRLRKNGEKIYENSRIFGDEGMAELISEGAFALTAAVAPHVVASYLIRNGEEERAEKLLLDIFANHIDIDMYVQGIILKGVIHINRSEYDEAISEFERAIDRIQGFARAYNNWGVALVRKGELAEAKEKYDMAIENDRQFAAAHINLGAWYVRSKEFDQAITHFERAVEINPRDARTYNNWGIALMRRANFGDRRNAIEKFRRAIELDPNYTGAYAGWVEALGDEYDAERTAFVQEMAALIVRQPIQIEEEYMRTCHNP